MREPVKIILAEDDADDRIFFHNFLRDRNDLQFLEPVENGSELLERLDTLAEAMLPDLIILDQNMPKLNGTQTLEALKKNKRLANIPVLIYSTYANQSLTAYSMEGGAVLVLTKPSDKEGYNKMIDDLLSAAENFKRAQT